MDERAVDIVLTLIYIQMEYSEMCYSDFLQVLYFVTIREDMRTPANLNQRANGPVNAHQISGSMIFI